LITFGSPSKRTSTQRGSLYQWTECACMGHWEPPHNHGDAITSSKMHGVVCCINCWNCLTSLFWTTQFAVSTAGTIWPVFLDDSVRCINFWNCLTSPLGRHISLHQLLELPDRSFWTTQFAVSTVVTVWPVLLDDTVRCINFWNCLTSLLGRHSKC
jgi:hypothetical protein